MHTIIVLISIAILGLGAGLPLSGCRAQGKDLPFRLLPDPQVWTLGKDEPAYFVVTEKNWKSLFPALPPGADLANNIYIVASWGVKPNTGFNLSMIGLREIGAGLQVALNMEEPQPSQFYAQVLVHPATVAEVARKSLPPGAKLTVEFINQRAFRVARVEVEL